MSNIAIQVENLSKRYSLGPKSQGQYQSFRDLLSTQARQIWRWRSSQRKAMKSVRSDDFGHCEMSNFQLSKAIGWV